MPTVDNHFWAPLLEEHRRWLDGFDACYRAMFEIGLKGNVEAALTEVWVRHCLAQLGATVSPNESLKGETGGPDFRCDLRGFVFYVEVNCITLPKAKNKLDSREIGEMVNGQWVRTTEVRTCDHYGFSEAIRGVCHTKLKQCSKAPGPLLLAIGTFDTIAGMLGFDRASMSMVLTGRTRMTWSVDPKAPPLPNVTDLENAAFLNPLKDRIGFDHTPISGVLTFVNGIEGRMRGVLHPNPDFKFDHAVTPSIDFGQVEIDQGEGSFRVKMDRRKERVTTS